MTDLPENWMKQLTSSGSHLFSDLLEWCLSEIGIKSKYGSQLEIAMAVAIKALTQMRYQEFAFVPHFGKDVDDIVEDAADMCGTVIPEKGRPSLLWGLIYPQVTVLDYRVDFLVVHTHGLEGFGGTVIECDGHDFHERTKEQAAKDRSRDRELQQRGYRVLRFTGSEIWKDPFGCADDALTHAHAVTIDSEYARSLVLKEAPEKLPDILRHVATVGRIA